MSDDKYKFKHRRGLAVIIVNEKFKDDYDERYGAKKDIAMATKTFGGLGFEVRSYFNQTREQMLDCIEKASKDKDIKQFDCFVCVISSHGEPDVEDQNGKLVRTDWILATDQLVRLEDLIEPVTAEKCPDLENKPKLLFVQACRGGRVSNVVLAEQNRVEGTAPMAIEDMGYGVVAQSIPIQKDFMLAWAVQPGFIAFHRPSGSWFIKGLCKILDQHLEKFNQLVLKHRKEKMTKSLRDYLDENLGQYDLLTLMTMVNWHVAEGKRFVSNMPDDEYLDYKKCMPWVAHQLVKQVYLYKLLEPRKK